MAGYLSIGKGYDPDYLTEAVGKGAEDYYLSAVREHGEPPGYWSGRGAAELGLAEGSEVDAATMRALYAHFYDIREQAAFDSQVPDEQKPRLGRKAPKYKTPEEIFATKVAAEPEATEERREQLMTEARKESRKALQFFDFTFSPTKSVTLLHAGLRVMAKQAREAGDLEKAQAADRAADIVEEVVKDSAAAGVNEANRLAGYTRVGYHGQDVNGATTGRYMEAGGWVVASFFQHTARGVGGKDGDPQLHVHQAVLNRQLSKDGVWRSLYGRAVLRTRAQASAVAERTLMEGMISRLGVEWIQRPDGQGWEIAGVSPDQVAQFSSRRAEVTDRVAELVKAYERKHGYAPNALATFKMAQFATKDTKKAKSPVKPSPEEELEAWEAQTRQAEIDSLAAIPGRALFRRGPEQHAKAAEELAQLDMDRVIESALADAQAEKSTFTRYELARHLSRHLPASLGGLSAEQVSRVLEEMTETALSPKDPAQRRTLRTTVEDVVDIPEEFQLSDGRSAFRDPTAEWWTTPDQLDAEDRFLRSAVQTDAPAAQAAEAARLLGYAPESERGSAPDHTEAAATQTGSEADQANGVDGARAVAGDRSAEVLGDVAEPPESGADPVRPGVSLGEDAADQQRSTTEREQNETFAFGLDEEQAAAVYGVVSSGRRVDVLEGFAGTGKSYTTARLAALWRSQTGGRAIGLTTSQNAALVLQDEGLDSAYNITRWLGWIDRRRTTLRAGDLVIVDEGSMVTTDHLTRIQHVADQAGAKVLLTGDSEQLSAPGAGGLMRLLAQRHGSYKLTKVRRFTEEWEREASKRLRVGDQDVLAEYDRRGRIRGGSAEEMQADARDDFVAAYLQGHASLVIASTNADAAEMSGMVRERLVELGRVAPEALAELRDGNKVSLGDRITARQNDQRVSIGDQERELSNRDVLQVVGQHVDGRVQARLLDENSRPGESVLLDRDYVQDYVELAYAGTSHAAQGRTLDEVQPLIREGISRQELYVMLSRGRGNSVARVITETPQADLRPETPEADESAADQQRPGADQAAEAGLGGPAQDTSQTDEAQAGAPVGQTAGPATDHAEGGADQQRPAADRGEDDAEQDPIGVLAQILETDQADETATERLEIEAERVTHMAHLGSMWTSVVKDQIADQTTQTLQELLPEDVHQRLDSDSARGSVMTAARRAVLAGHDLHQTLTKATEAGWEHARSIGQVLSTRIEKIIGTGEAYAESWSRITPRGLRNQQFAEQVAAKMDERVAALGERALADPPSYLVERLGEPPDEAVARAEWQIRAGRVEAYREQYATPDSPVALPPAPDRHSPEQRAAWMAASAALGRTTSEMELAAARDGMLWSWRAEYERTTRWAPPSVAAQLGMVYHEVRDRTRDAVIARAQAVVETGRGHHESAQRLEAEARASEELARTAATRRDHLEEIQAQRDAWHETTEQARARAMAADAELHRRHADLDLSPLHRSAEPEPDHRDAEGTEPEQQQQGPQKIKGQMVLFGRSVREWAQRGLVDRPAPEQETAPAAQQELDLGLPPGRQAHQGPDPERRHDAPAPRQPVAGQEALFEAPGQARGVGDQDDLTQPETAEQVQREREDAQRRQSDRAAEPTPEQQELDLGLVQPTGDRWLDRMLERARQAHSILQRHAAPQEREAGDQERFRTEERYYDHLARREEAELERRQAERQREQRAAEREREPQYRPPQAEQSGPELSM